MYALGMGKATGKSARLNMRIDNEAHEFLRLAARDNGQDLTSFVLGSALDKARQIAYANSAIIVSSEAYSRMITEADAPGEYNQNLAQLLKSAAAAAATAKPAVGA